MKADGKSGDAELIRQILAGDERAFSALCDKYEAGLHSYVFKRIRKREDAEEIVQNVFLRVHQYLKDLKQPEKLLNRMFSIAYQRIVARERERRGGIGYTSFDDVSDGQILHEEASFTAYRVSQQQAEQDEMLETVSRAIDMLPDLDRRAILLQQDDKSYREIACELGVTEAAVKHRLHSASRKVKELVDRMEED